MYCFMTMYRFVLLYRFVLCHFAINHFITYRCAMYRLWRTVWYQHHVSSLICWSFTLLVCWFIFILWLLDRKVFICGSFAHITHNKGKWIYWSIRVCWIVGSLANKLSDLFICNFVSLWYLGSLLYYAIGSSYLLLSLLLVVLPFYSLPHWFVGLLVCWYIY
jgi:hypothetical protein